MSWLRRGLACLLAASAFTVASCSDGGVTGPAATFVGRTDHGQLVSIRVSGTHSSGLSVLGPLPHSPCGGTYLAVDALGSRVLLSGSCIATETAPTSSEFVITDMHGRNVALVPGSRTAGDAADATVSLLPDGYLLCRANSCVVGDETTTAAPRTVYRGSAPVRVLAVAGTTALLGERHTSPPYARLILLDTTTGHSRAVLPQVTGGRLSASLSPDGRSVAVVESGTDTSATTVWDLDSGKQRVQLVHRGVEMNIDSPTWTPDGRLYVAAQSFADPTGRLYLADLETGDLQKTDAPVIPFGYVVDRG
jgi:WD40 repeat protein